MNEKLILENQLAIMTTISLLTDNISVVRFVDKQRQKTRAALEQLNAQ